MKVFRWDSVGHMGMIAGLEDAFGLPWRWMILLILNHITKAKNY